jgi:Holliday junction resolvase-like predicted endonuclease
MESLICKSLTTLMMVELLSESNARALEHYDKVTNLQQAYLNQAAAHHKASWDSQRQKMAMMFLEGFEKFLKHAMDTILKVASLRMAPAPRPTSTSAAFEYHFKKA